MQKNASHGRKKRAAHGGTTVSTCAVLPVWHRELWVLLLVGVSLFILMALCSYTPEDPSWSHFTPHHAQNWDGVVGAFLSDFLFQLCGVVAYLLPVTLFFWACYLCQYNKAEKSHCSWMHCLFACLGQIGLLLAFSGIATLYFPPWMTLPAGPGGILGQILDDVLLMPRFNLIGTSLIWAWVMLVSMHYVTGISHAYWLERVGRCTLWLFNGIKNGVQLGYAYAVCILRNTHTRVKQCCRGHGKPMGKMRSVKEPVPATREAPETVSTPVIPVHVEKETVSLSEHASPVLSATTPTPSTPLPVFHAVREDCPSMGPLPGRVSSPGIPALSTSLPDSSPPLPPVELSFEQRVAQPVASPSPASVLGTVAKTTLPDCPRNVPASPQQGGVRSGLEKQKAVDFPSLHLLASQSGSAASSKYTKAALLALSEQVEQRLLEFGVSAKVVGVFPGPVVTRLELDLAAGTKASKLVALAKDVARSLSLVSVRIVEIIPGKTVVGLELPNPDRETVRLGSVLASAAYKNVTSPLSFGLGKDIAGMPVVVSLAKMPHLLVAGTTGSGKSVCLNVILLGLLYKHLATQLRLILIDPKMLELSVYDGIPHLLTPVVTDMKEAASALNWCIQEMENRYRLMAALGVRNIAGYNQKICDAQTAGTPLTDPFYVSKPGIGGEGECAADSPPELAPLPYIVVLIDEFADMIMVVGKQVEERIARLAQKARAAGIHLILATQRPSVDVITGLIKANIPCRIAFQVSAKVDSRTILDQQGAEQLLGAGDMLYLPPGTSVLQRVHGAFVDDDEVHRVVNALKAQGKPNYVSAITACADEAGSTGASVGGSNGEPESDPLYDEAVAFVIGARRVSISSVQRRFRIGYNRAARMVEDMEMAGVVSAVQPNGNRTVLVPKTEE